ncbi:uncharacterized protein LOC132196191 isoform X1 [Neocloeon triangulifer]|uniref:uncharacterized protein LOC132196191 isoform X1 n=1 Tax=Neocloeon triangulifer TaxID=2078957 RepID=UPI00286ED5A2|nr:uncharacterized protein LOC132196191 isoform X1 [Neocloeon triangulifer]
MVVECFLCLEKYSSELKTCSFHNLPKSEPSRAKWVQFIRQAREDEGWEPKTRRIILCSKHFVSEDYEQNGVAYHKILKKLAVPSIFDKENQTAKKRKRSPRKTPKKPPLAINNEVNQLASPSKKKGRSLFNAHNQKENLPELESSIDCDFNYLPPDAEISSEDAPLTEEREESSTISNDADEPGTKHAPSSSPCITADVIQSSKKKGLLKLMESMKEEIKTFDQQHPLQKNDSIRYSRLQNNVFKLQSQILQWGIEAIKEELIESMVRNAETSEFVQAEYILLKANQKVLNASLSRRDKKIQDLESRAQTLVETIEAVRQKLRSSESGYIKLKEETRALHLEHAAQKKKEENLSSELKSNKERSKKDQGENEKLRLKLEELAKLQPDYSLVDEMNRRYAARIQELEKEVREAKKIQKRDRSIIQRQSVAIKKQRQVIRTLRKSNVLRGRKLESAAQAIKDLQKKKLLSDEFSAKLMELPASTQSLLNRVAKSPEGQKGTSKQKYDEDIRSFAITLYFYSPAAYEYVRKSFGQCLPHRATIIGWFSEIEAGPGFCGESWKAIEARVSKAKEKGEKIIAGVLLDDMGLKAQVEYNGKKVMGYVDMGNVGKKSKDDKAQAKNALNFMIVAYNTRLIMPCGYFFIDSLSGKERAELLKECIVKLENLGVQIESVTFDGAASNITMASVLGANLDSFEKLNPTFPNPADPTRNVNVLLDAVHMLKLLRNTLGDKKLLFDSSGGRIEWRYIKSLHELQVREGLHFANKLRAAHIEYWKNKMKVKFAAQLFSSSVATAIEYCNKQLHLEEFQGSEATVKFIRMINDTFDWLNSRNKFGKGFKAPLTQKNKDAWTTHFEEAEKYFSTLQIMGENDESEDLDPANENSSQNLDEQGKTKGRRS